MLGQGRSGRESSLLLRVLASPSQAQIQIVDRDHGSALAAWQAMSKPDFPTREQQEQLRQSAQLPPPEVRPLDQGDPARLSVTLAPHRLALIVISHKPQGQGQRSNGPDTLVTANPPASTVLTAEIYK